MKTLITGGAGFIGSHIQDKLLELGHEVAILDNLRSGKLDNLNSKSKFYEVDVRNKDAVIKTVEEFQPSAIFHLAAQNEVPYSMEHPDEDHDINIEGMMNVLDAAKLVGAKIIYSNTGGAFYGDVEEKDLPVVEDFPVTKPSSFYGVSKACAENYLKLYGNLFGLKWVSLRYANVFGPRQDGNREAGIVAVFTSKMLRGETPTINGDGSHTRDYVYVGDVVDANIAALNYQENDYFNIATGVGTSNKKVFDVLVSTLALDLKANYGPNRPGDTLHNRLSPQKALDKMGWKASKSFEDGVRKTTEYYKSN